MQHLFTSEKSSSLIPIYTVSETSLINWKKNQSTRVQHWLSATQFKAKSGHYCFIPSEHGQIQAVLLGLNHADDFWALGALPLHLPEGHYQIQEFHHVQLAALAWGLGAYQFSKYKMQEITKATLFLPDSVDEKLLQDWLKAIYLARDLINTPAEEMGPTDIESAVKAVAKEFSASVHVITGDKLLKENYPSVHAVGRTSPREPRVIG